MEELTITITKREYDELQKVHFKFKTLTKALESSAKLGWDGDSIRVDDDVFNVVMKAISGDWYYGILTYLQRKNKEEAAKAKEKKDGDAE